MQVSLLAGSLRGACSLPSPLWPGPVVVPGVHSEQESKARRDTGWRELENRGNSDITISQEPLAREAFLSDFSIAMKRHHD